MADVNPTHVVSGLGGFIGGNSIIDQLTAILTGHGVEASLAHNEATMAITVCAAIGAVVWQIIRKKVPDAATEIAATITPEEIAWLKAQRLMPDKAAPAAPPTPAAS